MCLCENQMPPIMTNSKYGQDHKANIFDTSKTILSQEMTIRKMEALIFIFWMFWLLYFFFKLVKNQGPKVMYQQTDLTCITRNIHVKYQSFCTRCLKVISKVKVSERMTEWQNENDRQDKNYMPPDLRSQNGGKTEWQNCRQL